MTDEKEIIPEKKNFMQEFAAFVKGFGVIGLALGVVIGGAAQELVASLSAHVITPLIGLLFQSNQFSTFKLGVIEIGAFIDSLINFLILLLVIYIAVKLIVGRMLTKEEREKLGL